MSICIVCEKDVDHEFLECPEICPCKQPHIKEAHLCIACKKVGYEHSLRKCANFDKYYTSDEIDSFGMCQICKKTHAESPSNCPEIAKECGENDVPVSQNDWNIIHDFFLESFDNGDVFIKEMSKKLSGDSVNMLFFAFSKEQNIKPTLFNSGLNKLNLS